MAEQEAASRPRDPGLPSPPLSLRWLVLVVLSLASFASAYLYDCVGPLAKLLSAQLGFSNSEIGTLQAMCSLPNLVALLAGGVIIDRIGERKAATAFAFLCLAGAVVTALSPRLGVMVLGRLLYGLGSGSLGVAINTGIAKWFRGSRLSFVFGVSLTINRFGSLVAQTSPAWAGWAYGHWRAPLVLAGGMGLLCFLFAAIYAVLEIRGERRYRLDRGAATARPVGKGGSRFSRSYWLAVCLCVTFYVGIFPFQTFAQKFFIEAHRITPNRASMLMGIPTIIAMATTPLFGLLVDKVGRRAQLMMVGSALLAPAYLIMGYTHVTLLLPVTLLGVALALVPAVLWPAVMLIVPYENLGKAFALMSLVESVGLTGFNFLIGWANDVSRAGEANPNGYRLGMWLFSASVLVSLLFGFLLRRRELSPQGHGLENPSGRKQIRPGRPTDEQPIAQTGIRS